MPRDINDMVEKLEYELAKQKAVQKAFPNAKIYRHAIGRYVKEDAFHSKNVNQEYTKFDFERRRYGLWVVPYCEVSFEVNGKTEIVKVHSSPKASRLVYISWNRDMKADVIRFARLKINLKNNAFKDDMLNACQSEIMTFIKNNPGYKLDDKHLDPRLKKLLVFI